MHEKTFSPHIVSPTKIVCFISLDHMHCVLWLNLHFNDKLRGLKNGNSMLENGISTFESKDKTKKKNIYNMLRKPYILYEMYFIHYVTTNFVTYFTACFSFSTFSLLALHDKCNQIWLTRVDTFIWALYIMIIAKKWQIKNLDILH